MPFDRSLAAALSDLGLLNPQIADQIAHTVRVCDEVFAFGIYFGFQLILLVVIAICFPGSQVQGFKPDLLRRAIR